MRKFKIRHTNQLHLQRPNCSYIDTEYINREHCFDYEKDESYRLHFGLKDVNDKEVYTGDYVKFIHTIDGSETYNYGIIIWDEERFRFCIEELKENSRGGKYKNNIDDWIEKLEIVSKEEVDKYLNVK